MLDLQKKRVTRRNFVLNVGFLIEISITLCTRSIGDDLLPSHRPDNVQVFLHETSKLTEELNRLHRAYMVDAKFVSGHSLASVNFNISKALLW
jgi:hypothetical protein